VIASPLKHLVAGKLAARIVEVDANHGKATIGNMVLVVWTGTTTAQAYKHLVRLIQQLNAENREGIGILQTVELGAEPPDSTARKEFSGVMQECEHAVKHFSVVHEGSGFKAASVRAIMSGVYLLARPTFPHVVMSSLLDAAAWHAERQREIGRRDVRERDIIDTVQQLRERISAIRGSAPGQR
jgi:hypothetical protein